MKKSFIAGLILALVCALAFSETPTRPQIVTFTISGLGETMRMKQEVGKSATYTDGKTTITINFISVR